MNVNSSVRVWIGFVTMSLSACGGQARDIGSNAVTAPGAGGSAATGASGSASTAPPEPLPEWPSCGADGGAAAEVWTGYILGQASAPDKGEFTLTLQRSGTQACGSLVFGQPVAWPPAATDARSASPLPVDWSTQLTVRVGFTYTLLDATVTGDRLLFHISPAEPYQSWCALQTPYPDPDRETRYGCLPNVGVERSGDNCRLSKPGPAISCDQAALCLWNLNVCQCYAAGCMASFHSPPYPAGDFHVDGDTAQGLLENLTAYLQRAPSAP